MKSFEEIMREKRQKIAKSSRKMEKPETAGETKPAPAAVRRSANVQTVPKTTQPSPRKYKFTPIVFDLDSKGGERLNQSGIRTEQSKTEDLQSGADSDTSTVQRRRQVSLSKATTDKVVSLTGVFSVTVQPSTTDLTAEPAAEAASPVDKSEHRTTPVIKRQSSSNLPSDAIKKRRTSVDSR